MASTGAAGWQQHSHLGGEQAREEEKRAAADAAALLVRDGMRVGLGTGSTVAHLLPAIAERRLSGLRCAATSPATAAAAEALGLPVEALDEIGELDLAIDGADQVDPSGWLVKGGGGALTREKIVAAAASRFVVIVSAEKLVAELTPPVPIEVLAFGAQETLRALSPARLRGGSPSPDGGLIADFLGPVSDPRALAARLGSTPGVIEHGLFGPEMVDLVLVGTPGGVIRREGAPAGSG